MPTLTLSELQHLIETSSYEKYSRDQRRDRPKSAHTASWATPVLSRPPVHKRPQSAPKYRRNYVATSSPRALSDDDCGVSMPRPQYRKPKSRPQSAKSNVSLRDGDQLDFSGLSNMMMGMTLKKNKGWWPKASDRENQQQLSKDDKNNNHKEKSKKYFINDKSVTNSYPTTDTNILRKSRTSSFTKFRYPLRNHNINPTSRLILEQTIPKSLRRISKYANSPIRQNCAYNPPVNAVTSVKSHTISSSSLPNWKSGRIVTIKHDIPSNRRSSITESNNLTSIREETDATDELLRNASYHYVYNPNKNAITDADQSDVVVETPLRVYTSEEVNTLPADYSSEQQHSDAYVIHQTDGLHVKEQTTLTQDNVSNADTNDFYPDNDNETVDDILKELYGDKVMYTTHDSPTIDVSHDHDDYDTRGNHSESFKRPESPIPGSNFDNQDDVASEVESDIEEDIEVLSKVKTKPISFISNR